MRERAPGSRAGSGGDPARARARSTNVLTELQGAAGNRALAQALEPRPVQRIGLDDIVDAVTGTSAGPDQGIVSTVASTVASDAQSGALGTDTLTRAATAEQAREQQASANVTASQQSYNGFAGNHRRGHERSDRQHVGRPEPKPLVERDTAAGHQTEEHHGKRRRRPRTGVAFQPGLARAACLLRSRRERLAREAAHNLDRL